MMRWTYHDAEARPIFEHYRVTTDDGRGKRYGYRYPVRMRGRRVDEWVYRKHPDADRLLYRLPMVLADPWSQLWVPEGERCADSLAEAGVLSSAHHGGAGKFTEAQAESLAGHRGQIILVTDRDLPGAVDVVRRFDLMRAVGISARRLTVVRGLVDRKGSDARDHFNAGFGLDDFVPLDITYMREKAAEAKATDFRCAGYGFGLTPDELSDFREHGWQPVIETPGGAGADGSPASPGTTRRSRRRK